MKKFKNKVNPRKFIRDSEVAKVYKNKEVTANLLNWAVGLFTMGVAITALSTSNIFLSELNLLLWVILSAFVVVFRNEMNLLPSLRQQRLGTEAKQTLATVLKDFTARKNYTRMVCVAFLYDFFICYLPLA